MTRRITQKPLSPSCTLVTLFRTFSVQRQPLPLRVALFCASRRLLWTSRGTRARAVRLPSTPHMRCTLSRFLNGAPRVPGRQPRSTSTHSRTTSSPLAAPCSLPTRALALAKQPASIRAGAPHEHPRLGCEPTRRLTLHARDCAARRVSSATLDSRTLHRIHVTTVSNALTRTASAR